MKVNFREKFTEILKKESKGFSIDWKSVEIKFIDYRPNIDDLPKSLENYTIRIRIIEDKIPNKDIDNWFQSHKFFYGIMPDDTNIGCEDMNILEINIGTIKTIALKIRKIFLELENFNNKETV